MSYLISLKKSRSWLFITSLLFLAASFFYGNQTVDIHLHDTMIVIAVKYIFWLLCIFFLLLWFIYTVTEKYLLSSFLTKVHIALTIATPILIAILDKFYTRVDLPTAIDSHTWQAFYDNRSLLEKIYVILLFLFLVSQVLYIFNFMAGVVKQRR